MTDKEEEFCPLCKADTNKEMDIKELIGEDYTFPEFEEHNKDGRACICMACNYAKGHKARGEQIKKRLLNEIFKTPNT